eukprot:6080321-Pleurochrysis_carterae.AAC.1
MRGCSYTCTSNKRIPATLHCLPRLECSSAASRSWLHASSTPSVQRYSLPASAAGLLNSSSAKGMLPTPGQPFAEKEHLTIVDGGIALNSVLQPQNPQRIHFRC